MKWLGRTLIAIVCLIAAIMCYVFGAPAGGVAFLIIGGVLEMLFWIGILGPKKSQKS